uniref:Uncharacterized protein n=1 Tax=Arundo donax TaxID=35708 RepID=A0A0A8Z694_ARUDO
MQTRLLTRPPLCLLSNQWSPRFVVPKGHALVDMTIPPVELRKSWSRYVKLGMMFVRQSSWKSWML